jgi:hypothetical protein
MDLLRSRTEEAIRQATTDRHFAQNSAFIGPVMMAI